jgi:mycothiol synthase
MSGPPVPGLVSRPYRSGDAAAITRLLNRGSEADAVPWRVSVEEMENWFARGNERFAAERDLRMVELDDAVVGYWEVEWVETTDGLREYRLGGMVDPDWRRRGIGTWLLHASEAHARQRAAVLPTDRPLMLGSWQPDSRVGARVLMTNEGYQPARFFFEMVRPTLDAIEERPLPEGLELRPVTDAQLHQLWKADTEAFRDHWGGFDDSDERFESWKGDPYFDPSLFVIAWDGDEIAGGVVNQINATENAAFNRRRGWLSSVFVRRAWRRRGLASALVARSLLVFRERGMTSAGLGVDADNPTGALGLYQHAGFEVEFRSTAYRKPMEVA